MNPRVDNQRLGAKRADLAEKVIQHPVRPPSFDKLRIRGFLQTVPHPELAEGRGTESSTRSSSPAMTKGLNAWVPFPRTAARFAGDDTQSVRRLRLERVDLVHGAVHARQERLVWSGRCHIETGFLIDIVRIVRAARLQERDEALLRGFSFML